MANAIWILLLVLAVAQAAGAATLTLSTDKLTYSVNEIVTVTVFGDDGPPDEFGFSPQSYAIYGRLDYNGALVNTGTRSQTQLVGELGKWVLPPSLLAADTNAPGPGSYSEAFNTIASQVVAQSALNLPGTLSTVTLIAAATGIVDLTWHGLVNPFDGMELTFFGLSRAPGASFTIVPEPGTGALLALGLLGVARARRAGR